MWRDVAVPYLKSQGWGKKILYSRTLRFWGIGESTLAEKVRPFFDLTNPTVAPYAGKGQVKLRLSSLASSPAAAQEAIAPIEAQIKAIAGLDYFGADDDSLASVVGQLLKQNGQTLAVAESCTGGGLGQMLTAVPGSSDYFLGGVISYHNSVKTSLLGVDPKDLNTLGAVSGQVAQQMAKGVRESLGASWGLSITGIAGPGGGTETKPVGLVYLGLAGPNGEVESFAQQFSPRHGRDFLRHLSICTALDLLRRKMLSVA
jgi:nicotinamide-nucleotide amidase